MLIALKILASIGLLVLLQFIVYSLPGIFGPITNKFQDMVLFLFFVPAVVVLWKLKY